MELDITLLLQLMIFCGLLFFLPNILFDPMMRLFEERERRIDGAAKEAAELNAKADQAAGTVEARMQAATQDARGVLSELRSEGQAEEQRLTDNARMAAQKDIDAARGELGTSAEAARTKLKAEANDLADEIVQKILGRAA